MTEESCSVSRLKNAKKKKNKRKRTKSIDSRHSKEMRLFIN